MNIALDTFNGNGSQYHLKNPKSKAEELALIAGGNKVRTQKCAISKEEEKENMIAARKRIASRKAKVAPLEMPW